MWALSFPEPPHELILDLSAAAQDLVARVQASRDLCHRLEQLRDAVDDDVPVHGDLRWANCLALAAPGSRRRTRLMLIDWEVAGAGPAAFDVGTVLAEYLVRGSRRSRSSNPRIPGGSSPARVIRWTVCVRPSHDFWSAYRLANAAVPRAPARDRAGGCAAPAGRGRSTRRVSPRPSAHVVTLLQLADNMLRHPEEAALALLALRE